MRCAWTVCPILWLCLAGPAAAADPPRVVDLWPGTAPEVRAFLMARLDQPAASSP